MKTKSTVCFIMATLLCFGASQAHAQTGYYYFNDGGVYEVDYTFSCAEISNSTTVNFLHVSSGTSVYVYFTSTANFYDGSSVTNVLSNGNGSTININEGMSVINGGVSVTRCSAYYGTVNVYDGYGLSQLSASAGGTINIYGSSFQLSQAHLSDSGVLEPVGFTPVGTGAITVSDLTYYEVDPYGYEGDTHYGFLKGTLSTGTILGSGTNGVLIRIRGGSPDGVEPSTANITLINVGNTPADMLSDLGQFIEDEVALVNIDPELAVSLVAKVNAASAALAKGNPNDAKVAMNDLKALVNQVEAQMDKKIDQITAQAIIDSANQIIASLGG